MKHLPKKRISIDLSEYINLLLQAVNKGEIEFKDKEHYLIRYFEVEQLRYEEYKPYIELVIETIIEIRKNGSSIFTKKVLLLCQHKICLSDETIKEIQNSTITRLITDLF